MMSEEEEVSDDIIHRRQRYSEYYWSLSEELTCRRSLLIGLRVTLCGHGASCWWRNTDGYLLENYWMCQLVLSWYTLEVTQCLNHSCVRARTHTHTHTRTHPHTHTGVELLPPPPHPSLSPSSPCSGCCLRQQKEDRRTDWRGWWTDVGRWAWVSVSDQTEDQWGTPSAAQ